MEIGYSNSMLARRISRPAFRKSLSGDALQSSFQFKRGALHQQFGSLVDDLEGHFVRMKEFCRLFLQCQEFVRAQVALVVGSSLPGRMGFRSSSVLFMQCARSFGAMLRPREIVSLARRSGRPFRPGR